MVQSVRLGSSVRWPQCTESPGGPRCILGQTGWGVSATFPAPLLLRACSAGGMVCAMMRPPSSGTGTESDASFFAHLP